MAMPVYSPFDLLIINESSEVAPLIFLVYLAIGLIKMTERENVTQLKIVTDSLTYRQMNDIHELSLLSPNYKGDKKNIFLFLQTHNLIPYLRYL